MARKTDTDSKGPGEFIFFALELLPDELWLVSIVIGVVFGLVWLLGAVFTGAFSANKGFLLGKMALLPKGSLASLGMRFTASARPPTPA